MKTQSLSFYYLKLEDSSNAVQMLYCKSKNLAKVRTEGAWNSRPQPEWTFPVTYIAEASKRNFMKNGLSFTHERTLRHIHQGKRQLDQSCHCVLQSRRTIRLRTKQTISRKEEPNKIGDRIGIKGSQEAREYGDCFDEYPNSIILTQKASSIVNVVCFYR